MTLRELTDVVGGTLHDADPDARVTGEAFLDSRAPAPGGLFVAVAGEQADGHDHAAGALDGGAVAVLGSRPTGVPTVVVPDPQPALQHLAHVVLGRLRDGDGLRVTAVTGSQGKTSVKDLLAVVLGTQAETVATHGSFNNEWGLPLTVLRARESTRHLVLEMGARGVGHLAALCDIARPDVSVVLNVGTAHLGEFGSREAIAQAKGELVEALSADGVAVLNADDPMVAAMADRTSASVRTFGTGSDADLRCADLELDELGRPGFVLQADGASTAVSLRLSGAHQALNATAAAAVGRVHGMALPEIAHALGEVQVLSRWRMEITELRDERVLINDSYNANPESMRAALDALAQISRRRGGRSIAVLAEMRELGGDAIGAHRELGEYAARAGIDHLVGIGEALAGSVAAAGSAGPVTATSLPDRAAALAWLRRELQPRDVVLIKASRGAALDMLAADLTEEDRR